jgi:hypothetical protein
MYSGQFHVPTIILEVVASKDLWIWHAFFSLLGSHNDINILQRSPLFAKLCEGEAPEVNVSINEHDCKMRYYLVDDIYPSWVTFVKIIGQPQGNEKKYFTKAQEAIRKDVKRAFRVLRARFTIIWGQSRIWVGRRDIEIYHESLYHHA